MCVWKFFDIDEDIRKKSEFKKSTMNITYNHCMIAMSVPVTPCPQRMFQLFSWKHVWRKIDINAMSFQHCHGSQHESP